ncbi:SDR family NAD(P)-dependent oxidoreductase [Cytobacillus horneckiae]|uniref:SDR family NAD(P)-dependent oxidoreductase n=1 Tax=Cytobacillus horneckiae TaxID=549687 RepID=UPI003D9A7A7E
MVHFDLTGRVAIVTGGSKGLGLEMARTLASLGADIVIACRNASEGEQAATEIRKIGRKSIALDVDVQDVGAIYRMVQSVKEKFGKIDILINNAGAVSVNAALEVSEEEWNKVVDTNLKGVFFCAQAVAKVMKEQNYGKIINISSVAGRIGQLNIAPYCASKAGVINLTKAFAKEWAPYKINVNSIAPSYIKTNMNEASLSNEAYLKSVLSLIPLKRIGETNDLSGTVALLASEASNYITGQTIYIDGGALA